MTLFGDAPANRTAHWEPAPATRGSMSILSSCIITLGLCVWTSVHLNIPKHDEDRSRKWWDARGWISKQMWRKTAWLVAGMFAPELIAFTAFTQLRDARSLMREMQPLLNDDETSPTDQNHSSDIEMGAASNNSPKRRHPWTLTHSFYAIMGGFVFDSGIHSESEKIFPEGHEKLAIGPRTLVRLAKNFPTSIPDISESHIRDKSNGNALAKAIVCTQAIWFLVQCVVRLSSQLPISLLELNTAAHCICTMVTYAFWWSKPLDIEEPSNVSGDETRGYCAALYVSIYEPELVHVADLKTSQKKRKNPWSAQLLPQHLTESGATQVLYARQIIHDFHYKPHLTGPCHCSHANCNTCCHGKHDPRNGVLSHWRACRTYDARDARRWALASEFHRTYSWINRPECFKCIKKECWRWILPRLSNRPHVSVEIFLDPGVYSLDEILRVEINAATVLVALVIAGAVYGGLHLIAWDAPFTSTTQSTLWRLSAVTIAAAAPYFYLDTFLVTLSFETWPSTQQWRNLLERLSNKPALRPSQVLLGIVPILDYVPGITSIMFYAARLMYGLARIFLVVESFISFAYLPIGVFQEPQWTYYFPHIL